MSEHLKAVPGPPFTVRLIVLHRVLVPWRLCFHSTKKHEVLPSNTDPGAAVPDDWLWEMLLSWSIVASYCHSVQVNQIQLCLQGTPCSSHGSNLLCLAWSPRLSVRWSGWTCASAYLLCLLMLWTRPPSAKLSQFCKCKYIKHKCTAQWGGFWALGLLLVWITDGKTIHTGHTQS